MKIDVTDLSLYTDSGKFLKKLKCPIGKTWQELIPSATGTRICDTCTRQVHDTEGMSDEDIVKVLEVDPGACLKVSSAQRNCEVMRHHHNYPANAKMI
jgi:hypothetical protein